MSPTLERVVAIVAYQSGIPAARLTASSAIAQDFRISGDDVAELAKALAQEFGAPILQWPWQRFAELGEPHIGTGFWLIWRLLTWPILGRVFDPRRFERLELGHIAAVIDRGEWFEQ